MLNILLLSTTWSNEYWQQNGCAPFKSFHYKQLLPNWDEFTNNCPIPAIGYYRDHKSGRSTINTNFVYLKINGMRYDEDEVPFFDFEFIANSNTSSISLYKLLPHDNTRNMFASISMQNIQNILQQLHETSPSNWTKTNQIPKHIIGEKPKEQYLGWKNFIGIHFIDIIKDEIGNDEFENRIADLLITLGFNITQMGHQLIGAYPDGRAVLDDFILVYDCKNSMNYYPLQDDVLSMNSYTKNEKNINPDSQIFAVFIAKSFSNNLNPNFRYFTVESLLYLLFKKLKLGYKFKLGHIKNMLNSGKELSQTIIDKEWI